MEKDGRRKFSRNRSRRRKKKIADVVAWVGPADWSTYRTVFESRRLVVARIIPS